MYVSYTLFIYGALVLVQSALEVGRRGLHLLFGKLGSGTLLYDHLYRRPLCITLSRLCRRLCGHSYCQFCHLLV